MIIHGTCSKLNFPDYGITIPLRDTRVENVLRYLRERFGDRIKSLLEDYSCKPIAREDLERVHEGDYIARLYGDGLDEEIIRTYELRDADGNWHRYDPAQMKRSFQDLFHALLCQAHTTLHTCETALMSGWAYFLGGGAHHAMYSRGAGFCLVNDIVIAIRRLQVEGKIRTAWVIDTDAHKGDGTAALTQGDDSIKTLSIHMAQGWPLDEPKNPDRKESFLPSDVDLPIEAGEEHEYLLKLRGGLKALASRGLPDLAVVVAGSDPFAEDELPSSALLKLSLEEMLQRERLVDQFFRSYGVPQAWLMAGGYGERVWQVPARYLETIARQKVGGP